MDKFQPKSLMQSRSNIFNIEPGRALKFALYGVTWFIANYWIVIVCIPIATKRFHEVHDYEYAYLLTISLATFFLASRLASLLKKITRTKFSNISDTDFLFLGLSIPGISICLWNPQNWPLYLVQIISGILYFSFRYHFSNQTRTTSQNKKKNSFFKSEKSKLINHTVLKNKLVDIVKLNVNTNIGLAGLWGAGKTTFLNDLKFELENSADEDFITIWIDLWGLNSTDNIVKNYFSSIHRSLQEHQFIIPYGQIHSLVRKLLQNSTSSSDFIKAALTPEEDYLPESIQQYLQRSKKRVLIFLDNVERLSPKEMVTVFQLVNVFDEVDRVQHIISYDRFQISKSLSSDLVIGDARRYLEKIIEFEVSVPPLSDEFIIDEFNIFLKDLFSPYSKEQADKISVFLPPLQLSEALKMITTPRELKRLLLSFKFSFETVGLNTNPLDLLLITILKLKYPEEFQKLSLCCHRVLNTISESNKQEDLLNELSSQKLAEVKYIIEKIVPIRETESTLLSNKRFWHHLMMDRYLRVDEISDSLTPSEADSLILKLNVEGVLSLSEEANIKIDNSWTLFHATLSKHDDPIKFKVASVLVSSISRENQNGQDYYVYLSSIHKLENILLLLDSNQKFDLMLQLIEKCDPTFYIPDRLIRTVFANTAHESLLRDELIKRMAKSIRKRGLLTSLDYCNLLSVYLNLGDKILPTLADACRNGGDFIFKLLELPATKIMKGDKFYFIYPNDHGIFKFIPKKECYDLVHQKQSMITSPEQRQVMLDFTKHYETEVESGG